MNHQNNIFSYTQDNDNDLQLSREEMKQLLNKTLTVTHEEKSTLIGLIEEYLKNDKFLPDDCLSLSLDVMKLIHDVGFAVICINNGANPNVYINTLELGPAHILVAASSILPRDIFIVFYLYMLMKGSDVNLSCYDSNSNNIFSIKEYKKEKSHIVSESVHVWLTNNNFLNLPITATLAYKFVKDMEEINNNKLALSVFIDDNSFYEWKMNALEFMCSCRNPNWNKIRYQKEKEDLSSISLKIAVKSTFLELFVNMLNSGVRPTYYDICYFISHMANIYNDKEFIEYLRPKCRDIISKLVECGIQFDMYQVNELGNTDPIFRIKIIEDYKLPLWKKTCSIRTDEYIPSELKENILFFGASEMSKSSMCESFEEITSSNFELLIKNFKKKNHQMLTQKVSRLSDFINSNHYEVCYNTETIIGEPMEYSDKSIAYYKDEDGKNWCFLSNSFENLLTTKINPVTRRTLPKDFILDVEFRIKFLNEFGISLSEPKTISKIIKSLQTNQEISNIETDIIVSRITYLLETKNLGKDKIINMKVNELIRRFQLIDVSLEDYIEIMDDEKDKQFKDLSFLISNEMLYILVCRLLYEKFSNDIPLIEKFVNL